MVNKSSLYIHVMASVSVCSDVTLLHTEGLMLRSKYRTTGGGGGGGGLQ